MKNIYLQISDHYSELSDIALATVIRTKGSTPQKPGSSAIFNKSGLVAGTVGGGGLEAGVQEVAIKAVESKVSSRVTYMLNRDIPNGEDALCGGEISVLIDADPVKHLPVYREMEKSLSGRTGGLLVTLLTGTEKNLTVRRYWMTGEQTDGRPEFLMKEIQPEIKSILEKNEPASFTTIETRSPSGEPVTFLLEPVYPRPLLVIAGAGHIGRALAHIGSFLNFEVTVIDDRIEYANNENIPEAEHVIVEDIGAAMSRLNKTHDTYIVIVTRGHHDDAAALKACIGSAAGYIGMIGSRNKTLSIRKSFLENGWATEAQWNSVFTPVGLTINSKTVEEIAVSIAAQLIQVKNSKNVR